MTQETVDYVREHLAELERMVRDDGHHPLATLISFAIMEAEEILKFKRPAEIQRALARHIPTAVLPLPPDEES